MACQTGIPGESPAPNDGYVRLTFALAETRAEIGDDGTGCFTEGDRIGLFVDNGIDVSYRELTYTAGEWLPRMKRSEFGAGELTFAAHYPLLENAAENPGQYTFELPAAQADGGMAAADLLFARTTLAAGAYRADLTFAHALHRLRIRLTSDEADATLRVRSRLRGHIDLLTGEAEADDDHFSWIDPGTASDGSFMAVIWPQPAAPYRDEEGLLEITAGERTVSYKAPETLNSAALTDFKPGLQTTISLSLKPGTSDLAGKALWVYGVDAPDFPGRDNLPSYPMYQEVFPAGEWFRYDLDLSEMQYLTWSETCGWYDCNKSAQYNENDRNLCWAATASNLLIWWLDRNRAYIEAYDRDYGSSVTSTVDGSVFERPSAEFKPLYSGGTVNRAPVFEFFKSSFPDIGSWETAGVNWFVTGNTTHLIAPTIKGFNGFFREVFSREDVIATDSPASPDSKEFNEFITNALQNDQAIGISVYDIAGVGTGVHAMTVWGAEYGDDGKVSHIYYCDNNYADQDPGGAAIRRIKIVYAKDDSIPELGLTEYTYVQPLDNEAGIEMLKYKVTRLCSVDLRRDLWAKAYPNVKAE